MSRLKAVRKEAQQLREEFLTTQASKYADMQEKGKKDIVQRIIRAESQKKVYQKIQYLKNQGEGSMGLSCLKIPRNVSVTATDEIKKLPDTPDHWETINVPTEIENLLLRRNQHHFKQSQGTPFTSPPLQAAIGYKADGYAVDLILSGQYDTSAQTEATSLLLTHLQARTTAAIPSPITKEQVLGKLKNWRESTTTSPSGLHLGHYHCTWQDPKMNPDDPHLERIKNQQNQLLDTTVTFLNYAIKFGYSFSRWTKVVNVMLQKDPGNPRIHRLRIIHLYEADYNLLLAVKWRQGMFHAEDHQLLNDGLYGSRPGRSAHDPAFMEVLQNEVYRMSMKPGINFDLDATSCYDRIVPNVAAISSRRVGMPPSVVHVNMQMLENARYYLKTNLGISAGHYSHQPMSPIYGTGQGSGNSPILWCFVCSALFDAFQSQAHGATFTTYNKDMTIPIYMVGFVDDCTQRANCFDDVIQPNHTDLLRIMTKDVQLWNDLLWSSGGVLEQQKCSFHLIQSDWTADGHPFLKGNAAHRIFIAHNDQHIPTSQKSNYTSHKSLGCFLNPAYNHKQAWTKIQKKNEQFAMLLETNYFSRSEAWTFYTAFYLPSITYPLTITPLTQSQCSQMDARFLRTVLPRCGYNRNTARSIRYAPRHIGGAGFKQLYVEQGILMVQQVQKYLNSPNTTIGKLLLATITWTQAFLGTSRLFLTDVHSTLPPVNPSYLLDLRLFLRSIQGSIRIQAPLVSAPLRARDRHIMDIVLQQAQWKDKQIIQINSCRRYLQAQTLADIVTAQGTRIIPTCIDGILAEERLSTVKISVFNQPRPGPAAWKTWKKFLTTICNRQAVLTQPLQNWKVDVSKLRHWPSFVYDAPNDTLYSHHQGPMYYRHQQISTGIFQVQPTEVPTEARGFPTATVIIMDTLRPTCNFTPYSPPEELSDVEIGDRHIALPKWEVELLEHTTTIMPPEEASAHIANGNILLCSDGSAAQKGGTFGFIVATREGQNIAAGRGPAPGAHPNSFRSEAYGVLAALRWLFHIIPQDPVPYDHPIQMYLDNRSVIHRINESSKWYKQHPNAMLLPEQDVITEIAHTLRELPIQISFEWVKGHQDSITPHAQLDVPARLNCLADRQASLHVWHDEDDPQLVTPLPHTPSQLIVQDQSITSHIKRKIREASTYADLHRHLKKKFQWDNAVLSTIDWRMYTHILRKYQTQWTTMVKHIHDISPTGHIAHRNNSHLPHECPACSSPHEDNMHVLLCPHPSRAHWRQETMEKISNYSNDISDPFLLDILREGLMRFHRQSPHPIEPDRFPPKYRRLIEEQTRIGWGQVYRARWTTEWASLQAQHESHNHAPPSHKPTSTWMIGMGRVLIDQWLKLWKLRNEQRHGVDQLQRSQLRTSTIHSEIHELYTYRTRVCPNDRHTIFHINAEDHIHHHPSLDALENWIFTHKTAILASATQAEHLGIIGNRALDQYPAFNPIVQAGQ